MYAEKFPTIERFCEMLETEFNIGTSQVKVSRNGHALKRNINRVDFITTAILNSVVSKSGFQLQIALQKDMAQQ